MDSPRERIIIVNADSTTHTVTADRGNAFDVSVAGEGTTTMSAPATAGSYPFHCRIHPFMKGVLIVR
jgi:plastocyanin